MRGAALEKYTFTLKAGLEYAVDDLALSEGEVECVDCSAVIIRDSERPTNEQRCDTDEAHHTETCGADCPVICDVCGEHHSPPYCGGASRATLYAREFYGGRKGLSAERRLRCMHERWAT